MLSRYACSYSEDTSERYNGFILIFSIVEAFKLAGLRVGLFLAGLAIYIICVIVFCVLAKISWLAATEVQMNKGVEGKLFQRRTKVATVSEKMPEVVRECYCPNGHNLIQEHGRFGGHPGISLSLKGEQQGIVSISPLIGDTDRSFFGFETVKGEIVDICCPTCAISLPVYNQCECGANLVAMFNTTKGDFADCIGICQRIGCLNSEIIGTYDLRKLSRNGFY